MPPAIDTLRERLHQRATDAPEEIERRLAKAKDEMSFSNKFDFVVINDDLNAAISKAEELLTRFLEN
jgi:guanylate kinase